MIEKTFRWVLEIDDWTVAMIIFFVVVIGMLGWSFFLSWLDKVKESNWTDGHNHGYAAGRRDERAETDAHSREATYPPIVETRPDGTKRRLDR